MSSQKNPENELANMIRDEEYESKSGNDIMEAPSGDDQDPNQRPNKKKRRHYRHTQHQIQEMESFFIECPHPDDTQRKDLGRRLGLEALQVKFWFQNKRSQMKAQNDRSENTQLRAENEKLRADNIRYRGALLGNATCPNCGGPAAIGDMSFDEQQLIRIENVRLREEIERITQIAATFGHQPGELYSAGDLLRSVSGPMEADKQMIIELAVAAMEELIRMAQTGEPLWVPSPDNSSKVLCEEEYVRTFPRGIGPKPLGLKSEASRESAVVMMNHVNLVEILMDVNQWSNVFAGIVSRAMTLEVLSTGVAGNYYNGALQVMSAEFQVPSPLVPTRENYFVRYCKQHSDGTWAVVDVSLDTLSRCRRRPSGCLIQEMPNGYSRVTWIEHVVEVDDRAVHSIYRPLVNSGLAFGAKRWIATLDRQCERLASAMAAYNIIPAVDGGVITSPEGRKSILKLAERMVMSFCAGVGASTSQTWTTLSGSGADDVRVMTRKSIDDPGTPPGIVLSAATSFFLPLPPKTVFDFLRDQNSRREWDILSNGRLVQEIAHIANGRDPGNNVSLLRVNSANSSQGNMLMILQESCTDSTGCFVMYAPVDIVAMRVVLSGGDPDYVALLPSGFAILPDGPPGNGGLSPEIGSGGSLITVAFQVLVDSVPTANLSLSSVATVNSLIMCTMESIKGAVRARFEGGPEGHPPWTQP
ncbi:PREDICTED: homeobox-leucine zipper protein MERISTEM L1-like [Ipomoea nil]|uniref:homeobox-leucine zipper protein MERISTEM L1-like n=1 Tax=Ipomoea nil TaxID=35883 RepID=UPI0009017F0E|nr:PREDICTED: homeobox-leucine zipper protein MERISTEM L1-like [Ipomoea nil]